MCILFFLGFFPIFFHSVINTTPVRIGVMKALPEKTTQEEAQKQLLYYVGEVHDLLPNDQNMVYMEKIADILKKNETSTQQVSLLVEVGKCFLSDVDVSGDLLCGLPDFVKNSQLQNTELVNIEIRKLSGFAAELFSGSDLIKLNRIENYIRDDPDQEKCDIKDKFREITYKELEHRIEKITFTDVFNELATLVKKAENISEKWADQLIRKELSRYFVSAKGAIEALKELLEEYKIEEKRSILEAAKALCKEELMNEKERGNRQLPSKQQMVGAVLDNAATYLFDLFLFDRILDLRSASEKMIIIIAGQAHITSVTSSLLRADAFEHLMPSYFKIVGDKYLPLPLDKFNVLLKPIDYFQERPLLACLALTISSAANVARSLWVGLTVQASSDPVKKT